MAEIVLRSRRWGFGDPTRKLSADISKRDSREMLPMARGLLPLMASGTSAHFVFARFVTTYVPMIRTPFRVSPILDCLPRSQSSRHVRCAMSCFIQKIPFRDKMRIEVTGGRGGDGCASLARTKHGFGTLCCVASPVWLPRGIKGESWMFRRSRWRAWWQWR